MNVLARDWQLARAQAQKLLGRTFDESDHPRDEHGRFADSGGGDDEPENNEPPGARDEEDVSAFKAPYQGPDGHGDIRPGVKSYAGQSSSFALNKRLRNPQYGLSADQEEVVKNLTSEIDASRTTADRIVTRGVDATIVPNLFPGGTITDKGFMSASRRSEWAEQMAHMGQSASADSGGAVIDIKVPKGSRMLTVARSGEDEVILQRGTTLKIISKLRSMNVWRIKAEVIAQ